MHQKISCSEMADLEFDLDLDQLLDPTLMAFTPTSFTRMETSILSLDGAYDNDSDSDSTSSTAGSATEDSNQDWSVSPSSTDRRHRQQQQPAKKAKLASQSDRPRQLPGPKSSRRIEDMTQAEINRRERRRDRNRAAASRCRQRRLDVTNTLLAETQELEAEGQRLEREIENLRKQRDQLEFVLSAHQPVCHVAMAMPQPAVPVQMTYLHGNGGIKFEPVGQQQQQQQQQLPVSNPIASVHQVSPTSLAVRPNSLPFAGGLGLPSAAIADFDAFNLGSTGSGWTPLASANPFMGLDAGLLSPTTLLGSPSSTLLL